MEYAQEVDIANNDNEDAIGNGGNNEPLAEGTRTMTMSMPVPPAALRASYSQQCPLRV